MNGRARVLAIALLAGVISVSSALAGSRAASDFTVTSTLDGKSVLPLRSPWIASPQGGQAIAEVDFFIDGFHAWTARTSPWDYGGLGNNLVTTFLKPGKHKFVVRAVAPSGEVATDTVTASVLRARLPPHKLAGTWKRKSFTVTISKVGWATGPNNNVDVQYLPGVRVLIGPEVMDRPEQTAVFCDLVDPPHHWAVTVGANDRSIRLAPIGTDPCATRAAVLRGTWTRVR
jgi:hypothetical protein